MVKTANIVVSCTTRDTRGWVRHQTAGMLHKLIFRACVDCFVSLICYFSVEKKKSEELISSALVDFERHCRLVFAVFADFALVVPNESIVLTVHWPVLVLDMATFLLSKHDFVVNLSIRMVGGGCCPLCSQGRRCDVLHHGERVDRC